MKLSSHRHGTAVPEVREWPGKIIGNKKEPRTPVRIGVSAILVFDAVCQENFRLPRIVLVDVSNRNKTNKCLERLFLQQLFWHELFGSLEVFGGV